MSDLLSGVQPVLADSRLTEDVMLLGERLTAVADAMKKNSNAMATARASPAPPHAPDREEDVRGSGLIDACTAGDMLASALQSMTCYAHSSRSSTTMSPSF